MECKWKTQGVLHTSSHVFPSSRSSPWEMICSVPGALVLLGDSLCSPALYPQGCSGCRGWVSTLCRETCVSLALAEGFEELRKDFDLSSYFPEQGSLSPGALVFLPCWAVASDHRYPGCQLCFGGVEEWRVEVGAEFCLELVLWDNFNIKNSQLKDQPKFKKKKRSKIA